MKTMAEGKFEMKLLGDEEMKSSMTSEEVLGEVFKQIFIDIWGKYSKDHLWTFAEFKPIPEEKIIDEYNKTPLIHAISSENVKAAIQKIREELEVE